MSKRRRKHAEGNNVAKWMHILERKQGMKAGSKGREED